MTAGRATLIPAEELFKRCNFRGCRDLATFILVAGGVEQVFCCWPSQDGEP